MNREYNMRRLARQLCILSGLFFVSCGGDKPTKKDLTKKEYQQMQEDFVKANKGLLEKESAEIDATVERKGWKMTMTGTGLRYEILKEGRGGPARPGQTVKVNYKIFLLDGTLCYSSEKDGAKTFIVEQDNVESGLHEGIQKMNMGSKARFILPSHLAHGLTGDNDKIPPLSTVIYEVELISITGDPAPPTQHSLPKAG
jgi:FKBP-type peptidyl-prolyl cis-trans isomerase